MVDPDVVFKALADQTRQRALALLCDHELAVSELVDVLRQPQSTVSRHLKVLRDAGLVMDRREGTAVLYSVVSPPAAKNGEEPGLAARLLDWTREQPLPAVLGRRLAATLLQRRDMSDRFFEATGKRWDTLREESFGPVFHMEAWLALLPPNWTVADIGVGTGYLLPALANHFDKVIGVDPVESMLEASRQRMSATRMANVELRAGDLSSLPMKTEEVDLAVAMLVLHHVPSPVRAMSELSRVVKPNGSVLIVEQTTHDSEAFRERMQDHWWGFDADELSSALESVGFENIRTRVLTTVAPGPDAPELFAVTGYKREDGPARPSDENN